MSEDEEAFRELDGSMKCALCKDVAEVTVGWVSHDLVPACSPCGHRLWDKISNGFNQSEAFHTFTISTLEPA